MQKLGQFRIYVLTLAIVLFTTALAYAVPHVINYQGYLTDTAGPVDGTVDMTLRIYDAETDGTLLWQETHAGVAVNQGVYNVVLGSADPSGNPLALPFDMQYYIGITIGTDGEMTPRLALTSVPYALQAGEAAYAVQAGTAMNVPVGSVTSDSIAPGAVTADKLGMACADGEVLMKLAGSWVCAAVSSVSVCNPGDFINCYTGPAGTMDAGPCAGGTRTCDISGTRYGTCLGEVVPAAELCDGVDNDCDGFTDNVPGAPTWYADSDSDGFGDSATIQVNCNQPAGYVADATDCNDTNPDTYPGAPEFCDGADNDCDAAADDSCMVVFPACNSSELTIAGTCFSDCGLDPVCVTDCMSGQQVPDTCNNAILALGFCMYTNNCQSFGDECTLINCESAYENVIGITPVCSVGETRSCGSDVGECQFGTEDCPNGLWSGNCTGGVVPVPEICGDGLDNDCSGTADDTTVWYADIDLDGFGNPADSLTACAQPAGYVDDAGDCDDTDAEVNPEAEELCNGADDNCNQSIDEYWEVGLPCDGPDDDQCVMGTFTCTADGFDVECVNESPEGIQEICGDSVDNNCDGFTDEGCAPADGTPCDDGELCTFNDQFNGGVCSGSPANCDDGNPCTDDMCDPYSGCVQAPNTAPCDDGNICTADDICSFGSCQGGLPLNCDDGNPCTDDMCDSSSGCVQAPNTAPCDDGNICTTDDTCALGSCQGGLPLNCDDGDVCTTDMCDPFAGCVNIPDGNCTP